MDYDDPVAAARGRHFDENNRRIIISSDGNIRFPNGLEKNFDLSDRRSGGEREQFLDLAWNTKPDTYNRRRDLDSDTSWVDDAIVGAQRRAALRGDDGYGTRYNAGGFAVGKVGNTLLGGEVGGGAAIEALSRLAAPFTRAAGFGDDEPSQYQRERQDAYKLDALAARTERARALQEAAQARIAAQEGDFPAARASGEGRRRFNDVAAAQTIDEQIQAGIREFREGDAEINAGVQAGIDEWNQARIKAGILKPGG